MPDYEIFGTRIHEVALSLLGGRVLTIFFKRSFSFEEHLKVILRDVLLCSVSTVSRFVLGSYASPIEAIVLFYTATHLPDEAVKTLALSFSIYLASFADLSEPTYGKLALVAATTQFLRIPSCIKHKLRKLRIVCGPVYVIAVSAWSRFAPTDNFSSNPLSAVSSLSPAVCALSAALLFRPDNSQTLRLVLPQAWIPGTSKRTIIHGGLMCASVVLMTAKIIVISSPLLHYRVATGLGTINVCLYLLFKCSNYLRLT